MNCSSCQPLLIDHLLGELTPEQADDVARHLAICEACRSESDQLERDFSLVAESVQSAVPPAAVKTRLLASIHAQPSASSTSPRVGMSEPPESIPFVPPQAAPSSAGRLIAAALVGVAVGGLVTYSIQGTLARRAAERAEAQVLADANQELTQAMQAARRLTPDAVLRTASFSSRRRPKMAALLTWDVPSRQIHFHAVGLAPPPEGKVYRLWLIDDEDNWVLVGKLGSVKSGGGQSDAGSTQPTAYQLLSAPPRADHPFLAAALTLDDAAADSEPGEVISQSKFLVSTPELLSSPSPADE